MLRCNIEPMGKIYQEAPVSCGIHSIAEIVYRDPYISLNIMALLESKYEKTMHPAGAFLPPMHHWWAHFPGKMDEKQGVAPPFFVHGKFVLWKCVYKHVFMYWHGDC